MSFQSNYSRKIEGDVRFGGEEIVSFDQFSQMKGRTVTALVNIKSADGHIGKYIDPPNNYSKLCFIKTQPVYSLRLFPSISPSTDIDLNLNSLEKITPEINKNRLNLRFKDFAISVDFLFPQNCEYFSKYIRMCMSCINDDKSAFPKSEKVNRRGSKYSSLSTRKKKQGGVSSSISFISRTKDFPRVNAEEWQVKHFKDFCRHIYYQKTSNDPIVSLYEKLVAIREYGPLETFFQRGNSVFSIKKEFENFIEKGTCDSDILEFVRTYPSICDVLRKNVISLEQNDNHFRIDYYRVLTKRLVRKRRDATLKEIEEDLHVQKKMLWDRDECRDQILSLLLNKMEIEEFVKLKEREFDIFEMKYIRKHEKKGEEEDNEEEEKYEWEEDDEDEDNVSKPLDPTTIDPEIWNECLRDFNNRNKFRIEILSFKIHVKKLQNLIRMEKRDNLSEMGELGQKMDEAEKLVSELQNKIDETEEKVDSFTERLLTMVEKGMSGSIMKAIEGQLERLQKKLLRMEKEISEKKEAKMMMDERHKMMQSVKSKEMDEKIKECVPRLKKELQFEFYISPRRRQQIRNYLKERIREVSETEGMMEIVVKFVLSLSKEVVPTKWQNSVMRLIDPLIHPSFYKFGFHHTFPLIKSVGCHWFSNSLVFLKEMSLTDSYEELICVDANCPLILNFNTFYRQIERLADEIVSWNVHMDYASFNIWGNDVSKNCQEFTMSLLQALDYTPFYPEVQQYIECIKLQPKSTRKKSNKKKKKKKKFKKGTTRRFLIPSLEFLHRFRETKVLSGKFEPQSSQHHQEKKKRKVDNIDGINNRKANYRIYFSRHEDVDEFCFLCRHEETNFDLLYPGVIQLLKGFCRAYWMRSRKGILGDDDDDNHKELEEEIKPSSRVCPFK